MLVCNLLQSSTTTPVTPFYSNRIPGQQPRPLGPSHLTSLPTELPRLPPSHPHLAHSTHQNWKSRYEKWLKGYSRRNNKFPVLGSLQQIMIKHQILLLTPDCFIACIILSCIILHSFKHKHTHTHTHTASAAADSAGDVQGEPNSHQRAESSNPWLHGWSKRLAAIALSLHSPVQIWNHSLKNVFSKSSLEKQKPIKPIFAYPYILSGGSKMWMIHMS